MKKNSSSFFVEVNHKTDSHILAAKKFSCLQSKTDRIRAEVIEKNFLFLLITVKGHDTTGKVLSYVGLHKKPKNAVNLLQLKTKQEEARA